MPGRIAPFQIAQAEITVDRKLVRARGNPRLSSGRPTTGRRENREDSELAGWNLVRTTQLASMKSVVGLIEFVVGAIAALIALILILLVIISRMPPENPLRQILNLLVLRIGATAAVSALAVPIEPVPGLDVLYDIGAPAFLIWFWYTFFKRALPLWLKPSPRQHR